MSKMVVVMGVIVCIIAQPGHDVQKDPAGVHRGGGVTERAFNLG